MRSIISQVRGIDENTDELILSFTDDKITFEVSLSAKNAAFLAGQIVKTCLEIGEKNA